MSILKTEVYSLFDIVKGNEVEESGVYSGSVFS